MARCSFPVATPFDAAYGLLFQALEENGGAIDIATGATFCLCRTGNGRAVLWGGFLGAGSPAPSSPSAAGARPPRGVQVAEVMGMPQIAHIAAGHSHALISDGVRVWALGQ